MIDRIMLGELVGRSEHSRNLAAVGYAVHAGTCGRVVARSTPAWFRMARTERLPASLFPLPACSLDGGMLW